MIPCSCILRTSNSINLASGVVYLLDFAATGRQSEVRLPNSVGSGTAMVATGQTADQRWSMASERDLYRGILVQDAMSQDDICTEIWKNCQFDGRVGVVCELYCNHTMSNSFR